MVTQLRCHTCGRRWTVGGGRYAALGLMLRIPILLAHEWRHFLFGST